MKHLKYLIAATITLLFIASCHQDDTPFYGLSDTQKNFSNFKEGSYWIMRDSLTGRMDSFVVSSAVTSSFTTSSNNEGEYIVEERGIVIDQYKALGSSTDIKWTIRLFGKGSQVINYGTSTRSILPVFFPLTFAQSNIVVNGLPYSGVDVSQSNVGYFDNPHVLLKLTDTIDQFVWELDRATIIR